MNLSFNVQMKMCVEFIRGYFVENISVILTSHKNWFPDYLFSIENKEKYFFPLRYRTSLTFGLPARLHTLYTESCIEKNYCLRYVFNFLINIYTYTIVLLYNIYSSTCYKC